LHKIGFYFENQVLIGCGLQNVYWVLIGCGTASINVTRNKTMVLNLNLKPDLLGGKKWVFTTLGFNIKWM
jgi:hypothetical protein